MVHSHCQQTHPRNPERTVTGSDTCADRLTVDSSAMLAGAAAVTAACADTPPSATAGRCDNAPRPVLMFFTCELYESACRETGAACDRTRILNLVDNWLPQCLSCTFKTPDLLGNIVTIQPLRVTAFHQRYTCETAPATTIAIRMAADSSLPSSAK